MLPVELDGATVFLAGVRNNASESFRYLRIPADDDSSVAEFMRLRATLADPAARRKPRAASPSATARRAPTASRCRRPPSARWKPSPAAACRPWPRSCKPTRRPPTWSAPPTW